MNVLERTFQTLSVPAEYERFRTLIDDQDRLRSLATWKNNVYAALATLGDLVAQKRATGEELDDTMLANIVFYLSPYTIESDNDGLDLSPWSDPSKRHIALGMFFRVFVMLPRDDNVPDQTSFPSHKLVNQAFLCFVMYSSRI